MQFHIDLLSMSKMHHPFVQPLPDILLEGSHECLVNAHFMSGINTLFQEHAGVVGASEGASEGVTVGASDGAADGASLGASVGESDGESDGDLLGALLGAVVGASDCSAWRCFWFVVLLTAACNVSPVADGWGLSMLAVRRWIVTNTQCIAGAALWLVILLTSLVPQMVRRLVLR